MARLTPREALDSKTTFYAKCWQQNGFYPIYKFVYDTEKGLWEQFNQRGIVNTRWVSWGYGQDFTAADNYAWWLYIFEHNNYILSDEPMCDEHKFDLG